MTDIASAVAQLLDPHRHEDLDVRILARLIVHMVAETCAKAAEDVRPDDIDKAHWRLSYIAGRVQAAEAIRALVSKP